MVTTRGSNKRKTLASPKQCFQCDKSEANTIPNSKGSVKDVNVEPLSKGGYTTPPQQFSRCKSHARNIYHSDDSEKMLTQKKENGVTENFSIRKLGNQTADFQTLAAEHTETNSVSILQTMHESEDRGVFGSLAQTTVQNSTCQPPVTTVAEKELQEQANTKSTGITPKKLIVRGTNRKLGEFHFLEKHCSTEILNGDKVLPEVLNGDIVLPDVLNDDIVLPEVLSSNNVTTPAMSFNYTEFAEENDNDDLSDVDSMKGSSSLICLRGYQVKPEYSSRLTSILAKHGDIGARSSLDSVSFLSLYMEKLCDILQQLSNAKLCDITEHALKDMCASVCHIEKANVEVGWLKDRLEDICKAKTELPKLKTTSKEKLIYAQQKQRISEKKKEYQSYKNEYVVNEAEAQALQTKLHAYEDRARDLRNRMHAAHSDICKAENEAKESKEAISESKVIVRKVADLQSLADGLV